MSEEKIYPVPKEFSAKAHINNKQYQQMYQQSVSDPDAFWGEQAEQFVDWYQSWDKVMDCDYSGDVSIKWFQGAKLNVAYNCIDRHLKTRGDQTAIIWEGDDPSVDKKIIYRELHEQVSKLGNVLKTRGVKKGIAFASICP